MNNEQDLNLTICAVFLYDNTDKCYFANWYIHLDMGKRTFQQRLFSFSFNLTIFSWVWQCIVNIEEIVSVKFYLLLQCLGNFFKLLANIDPKCQQCIAMLETKKMDKSSFPISAFSVMRTFNNTNIIILLDFSHTLI